jgi:release factor glutamine methyltransferase
MKISEALQYGRKNLVNSDSSDIDSQVLLCHCLQCSTSCIHAWPDKILTKIQQIEFIDLVKQRLNGKPVAHLTGQRGFWSLDLKVTTDTLIPRPDTELLVELALEKLKANMLVIDLGTGSGAIALSLAAEKPKTKVLAMDFSIEALNVAKHNASNNNLNNVIFWQGNWLSAIADNTLDMVVSNPPYIEADDPHLSQGDVRFEPISALVSGANGLDDIRKIVAQAQRCLKSSGWLLVEHGYHQTQQVQQLFLDAGFTEISSHQDFGGNDRVVIGKLTV